MKRTGLALGAALVGVLLVGAPALAQPSPSPPPYPPLGPTCYLSDVTLTPGQHVNVSGGNWQTGSTVTLIVHSPSFSIGSHTVNNHGSFFTGWGVPGTLLAGTHHLSITGRDSAGHLTTANCGFSLTGTDVTPTGISGGNGEIAFTGANFLVGLVVVAGLTVVGFLALVLSRRRTHRRAHG